MRITTSARRLGTVRIAVAAGMLAAPTATARLLGADTATARRVTWLTRMMAVRDGALGVGTAAARGDTSLWLLGSAVADATDAAVLLAAIRGRRVRGLLPAGVVLGAGASALVHVLTARQTSSVS